MTASSKLGRETPGFSGLCRRIRRWPFSVKLHLLLQQAFVYSLYACGAFWWAKRSLRMSGSVIVLTFHRVLQDWAYENSTVLRGVVLREKTFRQLAEHVAKHYQAVKADEILPGLPTERLRIAFTFDDGWADNQIGRAHV